MKACFAPIVQYKSIGQQNTARNVGKVGSLRIPKSLTRIPKSLKYESSNVYGLCLSGALKSILLIKICLAICKSYSNTAPHVFTFAITSSLYKIVS